MSVAIGDGVLGLEAIHTWSPPQGIFGSTIPDFAMNDQAAFDSLLASAGYAVAITSIAGLHSLPEVTDEREPALGRVGEVVYDAEDGGKTLVYTGRIFGTTMQKLREGGNAMRRTFQAKSREAGAVHQLAQVGEGMMTVSPHASYGSVDHLFFGRCSGLELGDVQDAGPDAVPTPYSRALALTIRQADPRYYESVQNAVEHQTPGSSVFITNSGSASTDPLIKVIGNGTSLYNVVLARGTTYTLAFTADASVWGGSFDALLVDFKARRAWRESDGADLSARLSVTQSNWWDPGVHGLDPGPNDIGVTGGTEWAIYWHHASD